MTLDTPFQSFDTQTFVRGIANLLQAETQDIDIINFFQGSTIVYYVIEDPSIYDIDDDDSNIRKLSGNEKMLLLYQWWMTDDSRMEDFPYDIIDYKLYSIEFKDDGDGTTDDVVTLFAPSTPTENAIIPPQPGQDQNGNFYVIPGQQADTTFYFDITVAEGSWLRVNVLLAIFLILLTWL